MALPDRSNHSPNIPPLGAALGNTPGGRPETVVGAALDRPTRPPRPTTPPAPAGAQPIGPGPALARPLRQARHVVGRLAAIPRLARHAAADGTDESAAERAARRRLEARQTLDAESGAGARARLGAFGAGLAAGALIGAGLALLVAPARRVEARRGRG